MTDAERIESMFDFTPPNADKDAHLAAIKINSALYFLRSPACRDIAEKKLREALECLPAVPEGERA